MQETAQPGASSGKDEQLFRTKAILEHMQTNEKQILITTETREVVVIRKGNVSPQTGFCPRCGERVEALNLDRPTSQRVLGGGGLRHPSETDARCSIETAAGYQGTLSD